MDKGLVNIQDAVQLNAAIVDTRGVIAALPGTPTQQYEIDLLVFWATIGFEANYGKPRPAGLPQPPP